MEILVLYYAILSAQKPRWKSGNKKKGPLFSAIKTAIVFLTAAWWWASSCHLESCQQHALLTTLPADAQLTKVQNWMRWKWNQKLRRTRENSIHPLHCWSPQQRKAGRIPRSAGEEGRERGSRQVHYWRKEQTASSSRKISFRRFMSSGVQKPSEEPLEQQSCVRRSWFPPSSPAWARWAGAKMFRCRALIYLFDEK